MAPGVKGPVNTFLPLSTQPSHRGKLQQSVILWRLSLKKKKKSFEVFYFVSHGVPAHILWIHVLHSKQAVFYGHWCRRWGKAKIQTPSAEAIRPLTDGLWNVLLSQARCPGTPSTSPTSTPFWLYTHTPTCRQHTHKRTVAQLRVENVPQRYFVGFVPKVLSIKTKYHNWKLNIAARSTCAHICTTLKATNAVRQRPPPPPKPYLCSIFTLTRGELCDPEPTRRIEGSVPTSGHLKGGGAGGSEVMSLTTQN